MKVRGKSIITGIICIVLAAGVGLSVSSHIFVKSDKVCNGVVAAGVNLSGMHRSQVGGVLKKIAKSRIDGRISIVVKDQKWSAAAADLGVNVDWRKSLDNAMQVGRRGNMFTRIHELVTGHNERKNIALDVRCNPGILRNTVNKVAKAIDRPATNASLNVYTSPFTVISEKEGIKIDRESAIETISESLTKGTVQISLEPIVDKPRITSSDLRSIDTVLASYTTTFVRSKRERTQNLAVASSHINKTILMPGEEFSYNKTVGERVESRGFRNAIIFVQGMMEEGVGGGICQVSSTLYNAVLLAGLDITERHHHSRTVVYVPAGRDATVAYGSRDLKFVNSSKHPIYISQTMSGNRLTAVVYGSSTERKNVTVYNGKTTFTPVNGRKTVVDRTIPPGTTKITDKGSKGVSTVVYRKIVNETGQAKVEVVSRDRYPAQKVIVATNPVTPVAAKPEAIAENKPE